VRRCKCSRNETVFWVGYEAEAAISAMAAALNAGPRITYPPARDLGFRNEVRCYMISDTVITLPTNERFSPGCARHRRDSVGFVIEKFNLFVLAMATRVRSMRAVDCSSKGCWGPLAATTGSLSFLSGLALVVIAAARFVRTGRLLDDQETHPAAGVRAELILSATLAVIVPGSAFFSCSFVRSAPRRCRCARTASMMPRWQNRF